MLITGRGTSGSWQIRGVQLGNAMGATIAPNMPRIFSREVTILVKRGVSFKNVVWDIVDSWPQPGGNRWDQKACMTWLDGRVESIKPIGLVAATQKMAEDCGKYGLPVLCLPHHHRPGLAKNQIRREVAIVAYEGNEQYLGRWRSVIESECRRRGWIFAINPPDVSKVDILLALRDADGYAPRNWKSNVKLANAQGSGTPIICNREAGYIETQSGGECWADTDDELLAAMDRLDDFEERLSASEALYGKRITLEAVAKEYKQWLSRF